MEWKRKVFIKYIDDDGKEINTTANLISEYEHNVIIETVSNRITLNRSQIIKMRESINTSNDGDSQ